TEALHSAHQPQPHAPDGNSARNLAEVPFLLTEAGNRWAVSLSSRLMFKGIEHTAIATADPEALGAWYEKTLDFPIVYRYSGNVFVRAADGTMLELIPSEGARPENAMKTPG